jgi:hypothetical protein
MAVPGVRGAAIAAAPGRRPLHVLFILRMFIFPCLGIMKERIVLSRKLVNCSLAALTGAMMLTFSMAPASAFTLASPSLEQSYASGQIDKVWWHHRHCWRGRWGHLHCGW